MNTTIIDDAEGASLTLDAISEMAATMNETYKKMKMIPKHLYGEYYLREKAKFDANHVVMMYVGWKMTEWDETFDSLKDKQTQVVAEFLTKRPLRFSRRPSQQEIDAVQLSLVVRRLYYGFAYCEDFKEMCARFRKFNSWEGDIMKLDYNLYGKYLLQNYHKMTEEERQAFFELDLMLELINKDMAKVMLATKEEENSEQQTEEIEGKMELAIGDAVSKMWAEGVLQHKYDHTWIMMTMNETEWLTHFATPTEYLDYMDGCGVRDRLPDRSTVSKYYDKARGTFPNWTFTDAKDKEEKRRNNVGKRFLKLIQRA